MCLVQKLSPPKIRRTIADYFRLYRSDNDVTRKMSDKEIRYVIKGRNAGKSAMSLARDMKVTPRHVRRIYARYRRTGKMHGNRSGSGSSGVNLATPEVTGAASLLGLGEHLQCARESCNPGGHWGSTSNQQADLEGMRSPVKALNYL